MKQTFDQFKAQALSEGFDEVLERVWAPNTEVGVHTHPFAVKAVIAQGEMWLMVGDSSRCMHSEDTFELGAKIPHSERYGPEGATVWAARKG